MVNKAKSILFFFLIFAGALSFQKAFSDTLSLKSGKVIEGKIVEEDKDYVKIEANGVPLYFERKYIDSIKKDEAAEPQESSDKEITLKEGDNLLEAGFSLAYEGKIDEAEKKIKEALKDDPGNANILGALDVLADYRANKISREYLANLFKGSSYLIEGDSSKAIPYFEKALKEDPLSLDVLYNLGSAYFSKGEYEKLNITCRRYLRLIQMMPRHTGYWVISVILKAIFKKPEITLRLR